MDDKNEETIYYEKIKDLLNGKTVQEIESAIEFIKNNIIPNCVAQ